MKIMISIPDSLLEKVDYHAKRQYKSRSGFLQDLINEYCQKNDYIEAVKDLRAFIKVNEKMVKYNIPEAEAFRKLVDKMNI